MRFEIARDEDAIELLSRDEVDLIFVGEDKIQEQVLSEEYADITIIDSIPLECRLVLAGARRNLNGTPTALGKRELLTVATSYPNLLNEFAEREGLNLAVTFVPVGGCESYASTGRTDLIFDIMQSGKTLEAQDLLIYRRDKTLSLFAIDSIKRTYRQQGALQADLDTVTETLIKRVRQARSDPSSLSYTIELLRDPNKLSKKLGEEIAEFMQAMYRRPINKAELTLEAADLLYVMQLVLVQNGISISDVLAEDIRRNQGGSNRDNE